MRRLGIGILALALGLATVAWAGDDESNDKVEFYGLIQEMSASTWVVGSRTVHLTNGTELEQDHGPLEVGACAKVEGWPQTDGSVVASSIESKEMEKCGTSGPGAGAEFKLTGLVETMPSGGTAGVWTIAGEAITVVESTRLKTEHGPFQVGACVKVEGVETADGAKQAREMETENPGKCGGSQPGDDSSSDDSADSSDDSSDTGETDSGDDSSGSDHSLTGQVKFDGFIDQMPAEGLLGEWLIAGRTVIVDATTKLETDYGQFAPAACVEVKGQVVSDAGAIQAKEIETQRPGKCDAGMGAAQMEFYGTVESLPDGGELIGDWTVDGTTVHVFATTKVEQEHGPVAVGSCVEVKGQAQADGSIDAEKIEVKSSAGGCSSGDPSRDDKVSFYGLVQEVPSGTIYGEWRIGGRTVVVDQSTEVDLDGMIPQPNSCVEVDGRLLSDGAVLAREIDRQDSAEKCGMGAGAGSMDFYGIIEALPDAPGLVGHWTVSGQTVTVTEMTKLEAEYGPFEAGACVEVEGTLQTDGSLASQEIETKPMSKCTPGAPGEDSGLFKLEGIVTSAPGTPNHVGTWEIAGWPVIVTAATVIDQEHGPLQTGSCVEVYGRLNDTGEVEATKIEVESASGACVSSNGARHAATLDDGPVSPGTIVSLFGFGIGPGVPATAMPENGVFPTALADTRVLFDGHPAPVLYASQNQINVIVPKAVEDKSETHVQVEYAGVWSNVLTLPVQPVAPGLFTLTGTGRGQAAALNYDDGAYTLNGPDNPVERGDILVLYATGIGPAGPVDGQVVTTPQPLEGVQVTVLIGGKQARVLYAGSAPGIVSGVVQLNVVVPEDAPKGASVEIRVEIDGEATPAGVTVAVH